MPRKSRQEKPVLREDDIKDANVGDYCYCLNLYNKVYFAEITKTFVENEVLCFTVLCQINYKFNSLPYYYCSFSEKELKGKKRADLKLNNED